MVILAVTNHEGDPALGRRGGGRGGDGGNAARIMRSVLAALRAAKRRAHEEKADSNENAATCCLTIHRAFLTYSSNRYPQDGRGERK